MFGAYFVIIGASNVGQTKKAPNITKKAPNMMKKVPNMTTKAPNTMSMHRI